jgi:hypothetical protein
LQRLYRFHVPTGRHARLEKASQVASGDELRGNLYNGGNIATTLQPQ